MRTLKLFGLAAALLVASPVFAHHPFDAEFDRNKTVTLSGTIDRVEWMGPHVNLYVEVKDSPNAGMWVVELGSPQELTKAGWKSNELNHGDKITIEGWRARDGSKRANAKAARLAAGRSLSAASSYNMPETELASASRAGQTVGTSGAEELPRSASPLPLAALGGVLSLAASLALRARRR